MVMRLAVLRAYLYTDSILFWRCEMNIYVPNKNLARSILYQVWALCLKLGAYTLEGNFQDILVILTDITIMLGVCYLLFNVIANAFFDAVTEIMSERSVSYVVSSDILNSFKLRYYKYIRRVGNVTFCINLIATLLQICAKSPLL